MSKAEKKPIKLTRAEKRNIALAVQRASNKPKGVKSAQDSIPCRHIFPDGICHVGDKLYTKTLQFGDINYQMNAKLKKVSMPLSITVHHATTDGYHLKVFFEELQRTMNCPDEWLYQ